MAEAAWGTVTAKASGGSSDPNILKLGDQTRIRVLEPAARKWRQHGVTSPTDSEQFRSITCPRGPDGRLNVACPLDAKPAIRVEDPKNPGQQIWKQLFPISRRFAVNVWDYESESVKVLIAGPQVFEEFDADAAVGNDPTTADYTIIKIGSGQQTKYKMRRNDSGPLPVQITPDMLHDLDKYEDVPSMEAIFKQLEDLGIDYDAIPMPSLTLDEALAEVMPYTKHKGMTMEQLVANESDFLLWLHGQKKEQGQYGDPVFIAMQTVLLDAGLVEPIAELPSAPPRPTPAATNAAANDEVVALIPPGATDAQMFPAAAEQALLSSGFTKPAPPEPEQPAGPTMLLPPGGGDAIEFQPEQVDALLAAGFTRAPVEARQAPEPEAVTLAPLPADQELTNVFVGETRAKIPFANGRDLVDKGAATFEPELQALYDQHKAADGTVPTPAASSPQTSGSTEPAPTNGQTPVNLDQALTTGPDEAGEFTHPALPKSYKTKGAVTQALNRLAAKAAESASAGQQPQASIQPGPAATAGAPVASSDSPREALMDECRALLAQMPEVNSDFNQLLQLFKEVANKQSIADFTDAELASLKAKLQEKIAAKA